jgi:hypothetical protein
MSIRYSSYGPMLTDGQAEPLPEYEKVAIIVNLVRTHFPLWTKRLALKPQWVVFIPIDSTSRQIWILNFQLIAVGRPLRCVMIHRGDPSDSWSLSVSVHQAARSSARAFKTDTPCNSHVMSGPAWICLSDYSRNTETIDTACKPYVMPQDPPLHSLAPS